MVTWLTLLDIFTRRATVWRDDVFGKTPGRKRRHMAHLGGIQKHLAEWDSDNISNLQDELTKEYRDLLRQEKCCWMQRPQEKWFLEGECNTKYFYASVVTKRAKSQILKLRIKRVSGLKIMTTSKIWPDHIYVNLYTPEGNAQTITETLEVPPLKHMELRHLHRYVSTEEVKDAIFQMAGMKTARLDGILPLFLSKLLANYWGICDAIRTSSL